MHEKNKYRHIPWNRYNLEKYRDINFWSYRPALVAAIFIGSHHSTLAPESIGVNGEWATMPVFCAAYGCNNRRSIDTRSHAITFHK